ncbi:LysR family transcriptional regulator [Burkholderia sp. S171]|uniref:LysR family transcriptional regulator n=1 Tax=Burkholderia sp. S171 TaxID=1641860 RepID=UPI00131E12E3|nr:LysR family transcriptional regulator [Burkholderia sp. S171]
MDEFDVRSIRYFLAVAHHGSYSEAAFHLQITQPAVSRQILLMERALNVRLFRRDGRRSLLTEAGQTLRAQGQKIVDQMDALKHAVGPSVQEPSGRLNVGIPITTAEYLMPGVVQRYMEKYPRVSLHLVQSYGSDLCNQLVAGKLDLALIYGNPRLPEVELKGLIDLEMGVIGAADCQCPEVMSNDGARSITLEQAAMLPLILPGENQELRRFIEEACLRQGVAPNVVMEVDGITLAKALVSKGMGYMFLGYNGVHDDVQRGVLRYIPISQPALPWRLSVAVRSLKQETLAARAMTTEISDAIVRGVSDHTWTGTLLPSG